MSSTAHDIDRLSKALADRYTIGACIGAGAAAVVYRATDISHDRVVALKVLRDEVAASLEKDRFLREIRILSSLAHPNILPLFDSGERDGFLYYAMPFVEESLRDRIAREKFLPVDDALRFTAEVGEALDFAHAHKVIHRDIKPANILLEAGHAIVADFGISKALDEAAGETTRSMAIGTPAYMSPEQASGEATIDGRSDLYSLACTTYEMLAGSPPFAGPTSQAIQARKTQEQMPSIRSVRPTLAAPLEAVLRRALAVVPADRFATAHEFVAALRSPPGSSQQSPAGRTRSVAIGVAALAAIVAAVYFTVHGAKEAGGPGDAVTRIAVASFINYTHDPARDDIGFMALDDITEGLQRLPSLHVVEMPSAAAAFRVGVTRPDTSARTIVDFARETGATTVLTGHYYLRGPDSLTVSARVTDRIDPRKSVVIGPFTAPLSHPELALAQIRTRAMGLFATTSDDRLAGQEEARGTPPTYEAYRAFSAGMAEYLRNFDADALAHFSAAIAADSTFATPRLFASICLSNLRRFAEADSVAHALEAMRDQLNPYYRDWLDYRLAFLAGDNPRALIFMRRLAARAPGTKATYNWAVVAQENGYVDEALRAIHTLPPDRGAMRGWVPYWDELGTSYHLKSDFDAERDAGERARALNADRQYALLPSIRAAAATGRMDDLTTLLGRAAQLPDEPRVSSLGSLYSEAALELRAHGHAAAADTMFAQSALWFTRRVASGVGLRGDSLGAARALYERGHYAESAALLPANTTDPESIGLIGLIAAKQNRVDDSRAAKLRLDTDTRPYQRGAPQLASARIAVLLGDTAAAISSIRAARNAGKEYSLWLHRTGEFAPLRSNKDFIEIMRLRD